MAVSSLPEWKQLLLERKRREEEARERREKEEEAKLASMPAWKRSILQRRRAKQEEKGGDAEVLSDTDSSVGVQLWSEPQFAPQFSPDPAPQCPDPTPQQQDLVPQQADKLLHDRVSMETIVPVHENPFVRTQSGGWRAGREAEPVGGLPDRGGEQSAEGEKEKPGVRCQDGPAGRGGEGGGVGDRREGKDMLNNEGGEGERGRGDGGQAMERERRSERSRAGRGEMEQSRVRKEEENEKERRQQDAAPRSPGLRSFRAENIIIIEQEHLTAAPEARPRWRGRARPEEQEKRGAVRMDLRELLAGGGSVTEIRASEVLIIKPSPSPERSSLTPGGGVKGGGEKKKKEEVREVRRGAGRDPWRVPAREGGPEKELIQDERWRPEAAVERGARVSQLLSRFGQHHKLTSRSKSSESFVRFLQNKDGPDGSVGEVGAAVWEVNGKDSALRCTPRRSFSFSDRAVSTKSSDVRPGGRGNKKGDETSEHTKELQGNRGEEPNPPTRRPEERSGPDTGRRKPTAEVRSTGRTAAPPNRRSLEVEDDAEGDTGFIVVPVRNTEGISFARRVPIRQEGRGAWAGTGRVEGGDVSAAQKNELPALCIPERSSLLCTVADLAASARGARGSGPLPNRSVLPQHSDHPARLSGASGPEAGGGPLESCEGAAQVQGCGPTVGAPPGPLEIQIPRAVFYVAEDPTERKRRSLPSNEGQDGVRVRVGGGGGDGGGGVERRDSWRIGKPLSRVESLREKIRQREREKEMERGSERAMEMEREGPVEGGRPGLTERDTLQDAGPRDGAEATSSGQTPSDPWEVGGAEPGEEPAGTPAAQADEHRAAREHRQEALGTQASVDVKQEVCAFKNSPQLPVSVPAVRDGEVTGAAAEPLSELHPEALQVSADDDDGDSYEDGDEVDLLRHVEDELRRHVGWHREHESSGEEEKEAEEEARQEGDSASPDFSSESLTPSPPCPDRLAEMSRIYNVKAVSSTRTGLCGRDTGSPVHLVKVTPHLPQVLFAPELRGRGGSQDDAKPRPGDLLPGVPSLPGHLESVRLTEQEVVAENYSPNTQGSKGPQKAFEPVQCRDWKVQLRDRGTSSPTPRMPGWSQRVGSPSTQPRTTTMTPGAINRSPSPEGPLRLSEVGPTPFSSPVLCSPVQSPRTSPSPPCSSGSSATLFTIRTASRGKGNRGATTITINPRRSTAGGGTVGAGRGVVETMTTMTSSPGQTTTEVQTLTSNTTPPPAAQPTKKRFPRVEDIEVIGGYQHLERSCLVKIKSPPKSVKVSFPEAQLEQVCEYPSESCMMAAAPLHHPNSEDPMHQEEGGWYEEEEEEEEEEGERSGRGPGMAATRVLKVDESGTG